MYQIINLVPWVLTHQDLSDGNIMVDPDSGYIIGVVDWVDATIEPFGMALWGLESVLGYSGPKGWSYYENYSSQARALFWKTFFREIEYPIADECRYAINEIKILGILLRYGYHWEDGLVIIPVKDTTFLDVFLENELKLAEASHMSEGLSSSCFRHRPQNECDKRVPLSEVMSNVDRELTSDRFQPHHD